MSNILWPLLKALFVLKLAKDLKANPRNLAVQLLDHWELDIAADELAVRTALNR